MPALRIKEQKMGMAVIGSKDFTLGFKLAGIRKTYATEDQETLQRKINEVLADKEVGILILHDRDFRALPQALRKKLLDSVEPVVIPIGKLEEEDIRAKIQRAIGIDLYRREKFG